MCYVKVKIDYDLNILSDYINKLRSEIIGFNNWEVSVHLSDLCEYVYFKFNKEVEWLEIKDELDYDHYLLTSLEDIINSINQWKEDCERKFYVFVNDELNGFKNEIINSGLAKMLDDKHLISKTNEININGYIIKSNYMLEDYIRENYGQEHIWVRIIDGLNITKDECAYFLSEDLYTIYDKDTKPTYASEIFNSDNPSEKIEELIDLLIIDVVANKIKEIENRQNELRNQIKNKEFKWN